MIDLLSLNPEQRLAVETIDGPVMILAGAGTGKTRVITFRIANMVDHGIPPASILAVTFTNKAAKEMQERVGDLIPKSKLKNAEGKTVRPFISTFHTLCVRILRRHINLLGYKTNFAIYDESDQVGVIRKILSHTRSDAQKADAREVLSLISKYKNDGPSAIPGITPEIIAFLQHIRCEYDEALKACNAVDFDNIILLVLRLFSEHPEVLNEYCNHFRYIMVDEYQDTNATQYQLVTLLAQIHHNLCVVGDDDQSIYGWRGARAENLLDLERLYPELKIIKLEQNYRSTNIVLKAANAVISKNPRRHVKRLWSRQEVGEKILLSAYDSEEEESKAVVSKIEADRILNGRPWRTQAILFRTNTQARPLETALRNAHVRYNIIGAHSFFDRSEIQDTLAYLRLFANPDDDMALLRIANNPPRGLSTVTMERLLELSTRHQTSVYKIMEIFSAPERFPQYPVAGMQKLFQTKALNSINEFYRLINTKRNELTLGDVGFPVKDWLVEFFKESDFYGYLRRCEKTASAADLRLENIAFMLDGLDRYCDTHTPLIATQLFLQEVTLDRNFEEEEDAGDAVTLITIHSCKGLEFPHVYIIGLEEGLLPHSRSVAENSLDEERRLFYVAITRAKKTLHLSYCANHIRYGEPVPGHPSQFLKDIPQDVLDQEDTKKKKAPTQEEVSKYFANIYSSLNK